MLSNKKIADRYQIDALLGRGGMGEVYRCVDTQTQQSVALKLLNLAQTTSEEALWRFRREFLAMKRLEHPYCVRAFEFGQEQQQVFFTMELLEGGSFTEYKEVSDVIRFSLQILSALDYVHGQGIIHRDLKPQNVLISGSTPRYAVLTDFGIAKLQSEDNQLTAASTILGTLAYLSPEQAEGRTLDARSDLYSFGVLFYEALLGRYPYVLPAQRSPIAYLKMHASAQPIAPQQLWPDIPTALQTLLLQLLAKSPAERPSSAAMVIEALLPFSSPENIPQIVSNTNWVLLNPPLLGRERHLAMIQQHVQRSLQANAQGEVLWVLQGERGSGKSRLLEEALAWAKQNGIACMESHADAQNPAPYSLWLPILRQILGVEAKTVAANVTMAENVFQEGFDVIGKLLPEYTMQLSQEQASQEASQEKWFLLRKIANFLCEQANKQPILICLEDLDEADESSIELLGYLLRALGRGPRQTKLCLLASYRSDANRATQSLATFLQIACKDGLAREQTLAQLSANESAELVAAALGASLNEQLSQLAERIYDVTKGNPFYILEILKNLLATKHLYREKGRWQFEVASDGLTTLLPSNFRDAVLFRFTRTSKELQDLLSLFASIGNKVRLDLLLRASGLREETILQYLDEAVRQRWLEEVEEGASAFQFLNEAFVSIITSQILPGQLRLVHQRIANALESTGAAPAVLGRHLRLAGDKERAAMYLQKAGDSALKMFDGATAAAMFTQVIELQGESPTLFAKLGRAHDLRGDLENAEASLQKALTGTREREARTKLLRNLAEVLRKRGNLKESAARLEEAMGLYGKTIPQSRGGIFGSIVSQGLLRVAHNVGIKGNVKESERESTALLARLAASLTHVLYYVDYDKSTASHLLMLNTAEKLGPSDELASAWLYHGAALVTIGDADNAQKFLAQGRQMAEERKANPLIERAGAYETWLDWTQGKVRQAATRAEELIAKKPPKDPFDLATLLYVAAAARTAMGALGATLPHLQALERIAAETKSIYTQGTARLHTGIWQIASQNFEEAEKQLREARACFLQSGGLVYATAASSFLGNTLTLQGKTSEALQLLSEANKEVDNWHLKDPLVYVPCFLAEALLQQAEHQASQNKQQLLQRATDAAQQGFKIAKSFPLLRSLALRVQAKALYVNGQHKEAQKALAEALAAAQSQQLRLDEEQCLLLQTKLR